MKSTAAASLTIRCMVYTFYGIEFVTNGTVTIVCMVSLQFFSSGASPPSPRGDFPFNQQVSLLL